MKLLDADVAPLGLGCWPLGGPFFSGARPLAYGEVDDAESIRVIHAALEAGIRVFDTAGVYGAGHAERLLGAALEGRGDALVVTKIGVAFDEDSRQMLGDELSPEAVGPAVEAARRRLRRDRVDVVLLHQNDIGLDLARPIFDALADQVEAGRVGAFGWSSDFPARVDALAERAGFVAVEHAMNVFLDTPSMLDVVHRRELVALVRSPLAMGVLGGRHGADTLITGNDIRASDEEWRDYFRGGRINPVYLAQLEAIRELLMTGGRTLAQGALGWLLARSPRALPVPGARTVPQLVDNAGALRHGPLAPSVMHEIETLLARPPEGPARPH